MQGADEGFDLTVDSRVDRSLIADRPGSEEASCRAQCVQPAMDIGASSLLGKGWTRVDGPKAQSQGEDGRGIRLMPRGGGHGESLRIEDRSPLLRESQRGSGQLKVTDHSGGWIGLEQATGKVLIRGLPPPSQLYLSRVSEPV